MFAKRGILLALSAVLLVGGISGYAIADGQRDLTLRTALDTQDRLGILERETIYLRAREQALTTYMLANARRSESILKLTKVLRAQGFTQRALPAQSRETLLRGLEALAVSMNDGLPVRTEEEGVWLAYIQRMMNGPAKK